VGSGFDEHRATFDEYRSSYATKMAEDTAWLPMPVQTDPLLLRWFSRLSGELGLRGLTPALLPEGHHSTHELRKLRAAESRLKDFLKSQSSRRAEKQISPQKRLSPVKRPRPTSALASSGKRPHSAGAMRPLSAAGNRTSAAIALSGTPGSVRQVPLSVALQSERARRLECLLYGGPGGYRARLTQLDQAASGGAATRIGRVARRMLRLRDLAVAEAEAANTGAADTGAADTGAADTGAADIGAADTGAADTGDRYSCDSFNSNETAEESVTVSGGNRNGTLSYADGGDGTGDGSGDGTGGYAEGGKIAVEAGTDDANVTAAPAETAGGEPDGSYIGDEPGGGYSSGGPLLVLRGARAARDARMRKGVGYISLRRYVMHLAAEAHAARIARSAVFDNFERERQAAAVAVEEVAARERAFVHRTAAASRGYLVTAPAPKGGIHIGANTAAAVVAVGPEAARELAAKIQETAEEEVMMRVAETELREAHVERVALREVMHARELAPYFIGRVARGQMGRQQAKIKKIEALGVVATKIQAAQRRHAAQSKYKTTKAGREYDMLQAELAWYETFRAQAAARIQKVARGKQTRRREVFLRASKQEDLTASRAAAVVRRREKAHSAVEAATAEAAATAMQAVVRGKAAREERADLLLVRQAQQRAAELALLERAAAEAALAAAAAAAIAAELLQAAEAQYIAADRRAAAVSIQSAARGCNLRNSILANSKNRYAAVAIQAIARGRRGRRKLGEEMAEVERKERVVLEVRDAAKARMRKMQKRAEAVADALAAIVFGHVREVTRELVAELLAEDTGAADTGVVGTGAADTGATDTGAADTGVAGTGAADTEAADTGVADTGAVDTGAVDTGAADTGVGQSSDTGAELLEGHAVAAADSQGQAGEALTADSQGADSQAGQVRSIDSEEEAADTGAPDTGVADTELMDTGAPDTGVADTELMDNGAADVGPADTEAAVTEPAARGSPLEAAIVVVDESAEDDHRTSLAQESSKAQSRRQSVPDTPALRAALSTDAGGPATRAATTPAVAPSPAAAPPAPPTPPAAPAKPDALDDLFGDDFGEADGGEGASGDLDDLLAGDGFD